MYTIYTYLCTHMCTQMCKINEQIINIKSRSIPDTDLGKLLGFEIVGPGPVTLSFVRHPLSQSYDFCMTGLCF